VASCDESPVEPVEPLVSGPAATLPAGALPGATPVRPPALLFRPPRRAARPLRWRVGLNYGYYWSDLVFGGNTDAAIATHSVSATAEVRPTPWLTLQVGGGAVLGGTLTTVESRHIVRPGGLAAFSAAFRVLDGRGWTPFIVLGASVAVSAASTIAPTVDATAAGLTALDVRASVTVGKTFGGAWSPYVAARAFGGPVWWRVNGTDVVGTDRYHYQFAVGLVVAIAGRADLYVEGGLLGEHRLAAGLGVSF
jgi:hypothetical protein